MWECNCNMENQYGTSVTGNLYQINYCEEGTRNTSIVWLGVMANVTIDCTALSSRHWKFYVNSTPDYTFTSFFLAFVFWSEYQTMRVLSTLAIILGVLMAFQGSLQSLSVGESTSFQGQEKLVFQWNQPSHPNGKPRKSRNSLSNKSTETFNKHIMKRP